MKKSLGTDGQIDKLSQAMKMANDASTSKNYVERIGALTLYAGITDFLVIQAARLVEQIILKGQLADGGTPGFEPHEDQYFYDEQVSTRHTLREIKKLLPFKASNPAQSSQAERVTDLAGVMIDKGINFLNYRNPIIHQIGSPRTSFDKLLTLCDKAISAFQDFREAHQAFFEAAAPYRFGQAELDRVYGPKEERESAT